MEVRYCPDLAGEQQKIVIAEVRDFLLEQQYAWQKMTVISATIKSQVLDVNIGDDRRIIVKRHTSAAAFNRERLAYLLLREGIPRCMAIDSKRMMLLLEHCGERSDNISIDLDRLGQDLAHLHLQFDEVVRRLPVDIQRKILLDQVERKSNALLEAAHAVRDFERSYLPLGYIACSVGDMKFAHYIPSRRIFVDLETFAPGLPNCLDLGMIILSEKLDMPACRLLVKGYRKLLSAQTNVSEVTLLDSAMRAAEFLSCETW